MKIKFVAMFVVGVVVGCACNIGVVSAQSATSDTTRVVRALEDISETLKRLERKVK